MNRTDLDLPVAASKPSGAARALLHGIVDYAGSFPPASLPLREALEHHLFYLQSPWSWMLACFVCPALRLSELSDDLRQTAVPVTFSMLPSGGDTADRFLSRLAGDCRAAARFAQEHGDRVRFEQAEARLPADLREASAPAYRNFLHGIRQTMEAAHLGEADFFVEVPIGEERTVTQLVQAIAGSENATGRFGLKMRTGGDADIPTPRDVAGAIVMCREAGVAFKATAGLHHPIRHVDGGLPMHGFLNLFVAAALADAHELDEDRIASILTDEDAEHFTLGEAHVGWTTLTADAASVERTRGALARSLGSCSFAEPVNDLRALGFL